MVVSGMTHLTRLSKLLIAGIVLGSGATAFQTYGARLTSDPKHDSVAGSSVAPAAIDPCASPYRSGQGTWRS